MVEEEIERPSIRAEATTDALTDQLDVWQIVQNKDGLGTAAGKACCSLSVQVRIDGIFNEDAHRHDAGTHRPQRCR
jgi:hypothetical protein